MAASKGLIVYERILNERTYFAFADILECKS